MKKKWVTIAIIAIVAIVVWKKFGPAIMAKFSKL